MDIQPVSMLMMTEKHTNRKNIYMQYDLQYSYNKSLTKWNSSQMIVSLYIIYKMLILFNNGSFLR